MDLERSGGRRPKSSGDGLAIWRYVALPVLWPSLLGTTILLFANAFGAVATAYALTGSSLNIVPILLYAQIRGDVLHDPHLGYALALGMIFDHRRFQHFLHLAARPAASGGQDEVPAPHPLAGDPLGLHLLPVPADSDVRVLAAQTAWGILA
jgi:hypothetical protein